MKALLIIDGKQLETGLNATLYRGLHDTENSSDVLFHQYLITHYQKQGWDTLITLSFIIDRRPDA